MLAVLHTVLLTVLLTTRLSQRTGQTRPQAEVERSKGTTSTSKPYPARLVLRFVDWVVNVQRVLADLDATGERHGVILARRKGS